jgi:hypothetical protein
MSKQYLCQYCGEDKPEQFYASKGKKTCKKCTKRDKTSVNGESFPPSDLGSPFKGFQVPSTGVQYKQSPSQGQTGKSETLALEREVEELRKTVETIYHRAESLDTQQVHEEIKGGLTFRERIEQKWNLMDEGFAKVKKDNESFRSSVTPEVVKYVLGVISAGVVRKETFEAELKKRDMELEKKNKELAELKESVEDMKANLKGVIRYLWDCVEKGQIVPAVPIEPKRSDSPVPQSPESILAGQFDRKELFPKPLPARMGTFHKLPGGRLEAVSPFQVFLDDSRKKPVIK